MAVTAVDAEPGHVVLMTERYRLRLPNTGISDVGRSLHDVGHAAQCGNKENGAKDGGAGQRVRAAMKDLRHFSYESVLEEIWRSICSLTRPLFVRSFWFRVGKPPTGFSVVCETGNYKYFFELCRAFLKILTRKISRVSFARMMLVFSTTNAASG